MAYRNALKRLLTLFAYIRKLSNAYVCYYLIEINFASDYVVGCAVEKLTDQGLQEVAYYFQALAEPNRLRILNFLRDGEKNVGEITTLCGTTAANVSRHLSTLAKHGLVAREVRGTAVYYRIADPQIYKLCDLVCGSIARRIGKQAAAFG